MRAGDLLTVQQVLSVLPLGRSTVYRLIQEGHLPALRVRTSGSRRGRVLIERAGLEAYVEGLRGCRPARRVHPQVDVDGLLRRVRKRLRRGETA